MSAMSKQPGCQSVGTRPSPQVQHAGAPVCRLRLCRLQRHVPHKRLQVLVRDELRSQAQCGRARSSRRAARAPGRCLGSRLAHARRDELKQALHVSKEARVAGRHGAQPHDAAGVAVT
eukprot:49223-Chlamydomonas_euryale.AAC.5